MRASSRRPSRAPSSIPPARLRTPGATSPLTGRPGAVSQEVSHHPSIPIPPIFSRLPSGGSLGRSRVCLAANPSLAFHVYQERLPLGFPSYPPSNTSRLSRPRPWRRLSLAGPKVRFSKAQFNAASSRKPSRHPRLPGSALVSSMVLICTSRLSTPPPFPGRRGFRTQFPTQGPCSGGERARGPAPAPTAGRRGLTSAQSQEEAQSQVRTAHVAI